MERHREYLIRLPSATAEAVNGLAVAAQQPRAAIIAMLVQAGLSTLVDSRETLTPRQWRGLIVEYRARQQSLK